MSEIRVRRLLVVEDDEGYCDFLNHVLSPLYDLTLCRTLEQALAKIDSETFDLIVTDINLENKSGLEIPVKMREKGLLEKCPVIVYSSLTDLGTKQRASGLGTVSFVEKPFKSELLIDQIDAALKKKR